MFDLDGALGHQHAPERRLLLGRREGLDGRSLHLRFPAARRPMLKGRLLQEALCQPAHFG